MASFWGNYKAPSVSRCFGNSAAALLWGLWELMITETPLMVIADTPGQAA